MSSPNETWAPTSWRQKTIRQNPSWPDAAELAAVEGELRAQPPLVFAGEARDLISHLAAVADGKAFLLQAGDCAESFHDAAADSIRDKLKIILQMAVALTYASGVPVLKVGRIAGQFAKPRSEEFETQGDQVLDTFRGHIVNGEEFTAAARRPDARRLLAAYHQSASTLNLLRAFTKGGFAALSRVHQWNQEFVEGSPQGRHYAEVADDIERAVRFMRACGIDMARESSLSGVDFYTSHEALILPYEEALTRQDSLTGNWYDCSAHMLWIGDRTRHRDEAHVEFLRGVHNPLGIKVGPSTDADELIAILDTLNPQRIVGRITLISRMGHRTIETALAPLVQRVRDEGHPVVWACDPMHGNTIRADSGRKTRRFDDVLSEVKSFFEIHRSLDSWPGGLHIELTGDNVTECLGGGSDLNEADLETNYTSVCDPRLNASQSLDLAFQVSEFLQA